MLDISTLEKFDPKGMYKIYDIWPEIARESFESNQDSVDFNNVDHIVFAGMGGMGGSGALGDVFHSILSKINLHVTVVKGYLLPQTVDSNTLVITTSISGNTPETLTILDSAKKMGCNIVAFSSGGKMKDYCTKNSIKYRQIPLYHSSRASFTSFLYSMLKILEYTIPLENDEILKSTNQLEKLRMEISSNNLTKSNSSLTLAEWLSNISFIYYPSGLMPVAIRFKNSLQENTKSHALTEDVIEGCHNSIVAWEKSTFIKPILLRGKDDQVKTKERWNIIKEYFEENNIEYKEVFSVGGSILSKLINLIYLLDYSTIYRAVISGLDPSPVCSIDYVKNRL